MTTKRLYLHVGTHKTGTTSFQASLGKNKRVLRAKGVAPLAAPKGNSHRFWHPVRYNNTLLAQSFLRDGVATVTRLAHNRFRAPSEARARVQAEALARIAQSPEPRLILSAEAFCFLRTQAEAQAVAAFLAATGREMVIVVAWRRPEDWAASWHDHIAKSPVRARRNLMRPDAKRADGAWYFDKPAIRAFWGQFGPLREVDYDAALAGEGNVIPALYRAMDVDPAGLKLAFSRNRRSRAP